MIHGPDSFKDDVPSADLMAIPGYQEAESTRYSSNAFMILPLASGRVAVLGHMRSLHAICDTLEEVVEAGKTIPFNVLMRRATEPKVAYPKTVYRPPTGKALPKLSLEDLGI